MVNSDRSDDRRPIRVLVAKCGLDGHDRGAKVVARALMDAGMEVIYTGIRRTPEEVVAAAVQEDVDVVGISSLSGGHMAQIPRVVELLRGSGGRTTAVVAGGIIPVDDAAALLAGGVAAIFPPGTTLAEITGTIRGLAGR
jgi:methylmalonyl-CoA mutase C-terminal domain/subunit